MRILGSVVVLVFASVAWAGPTKHVGKELTKGVGEELKKEGLDVEKGARDVASGLVQGIQQRDKEAAAAARSVGRSIAQGLFGELRTQLGERGDGGLAKSLAGAGGRSTEAVVHGMGEELARWIPACEGKDRAACVEAFVTRLAYASSRAAAEGAADGAPPWTVVLTFSSGVAAGLVAAALAALLLGQRRTRRHLEALTPQRA